MSGSQKRPEPQSQRCPLPGHPVTCKRQPAPASACIRCPGRGADCRINAQERMPSWTPYSDSIHPLKIPIPGGNVPDVSTPSLQTDEGRQKTSGYMPLPDPLPPPSLQASPQPSAWSAPSDTIQCLLEEEFDVFIIAETCSGYQLFKKP